MRNRVKNNSVAFFGIVCFLAILLMSVGYATINTVTMTITGTASAVQPNDIYISEVAFVNSSDASASILNYSSTTMHSVVTLSSSSGSSYITECVKICNNTSNSYFFREVLYDEEYYSNQGIVFEISNFNIRDKINPGETKDIYITFKYANNTLASSNQLDSYLNFRMTDTLPMEVDSTDGSATYTGEEITGNASVNVNIPESGYTIKYGTTEENYTLDEMPGFINVGTYTVYYKVTATDYDDFEGNLTITITKANATATAPTAKNLTYSGLEQELINAGSTEDGTIQYKVGTGSYSTSIPKETNAGTYIVYYKVIGDSNHNDSSEESISVTITKANATVTAPTAKILTYTGSAQELINAGSSTDGTIQYKVGTGSYSTSIPKGTNAGTYTVYYKVVGDTNHKDSSEGNISVTIAKAESTYTTEPASKSLSYTATAQQLVTAGSTSCGTIQYKLSGGSYSTALPTATDVGTYTVYYKIVGDSNHNDSSEKSVSVKINELATYSITYTTGDMPYTPSSSKTSYNVLTETFALDSPTSPGYTFKGWYNNSACTGTAITQITKGSTGDLSLWAKWTFVGYVYESSKYDSGTYSMMFAPSVSATGTINVLYNNTSFGTSVEYESNNSETADIVSKNSTLYLAPRSANSVWTVVGSSDYYQITSATGKYLYSNGSSLCIGPTSKPSTGANWRYAYTFTGSDGLKNNIDNIFYKWRYLCYYTDSSTYKLTTSTSSTKVKAYTYVQYTEDSSY